MTILGDAFIRIRPDTTGFSASLTTRVKGAAKAAAAAFGAAFVIREVTQAVVGGVKAFAEAEQAQLKLSEALANFPQLAGENIKAFQDLNEALAEKTRFDDDAFAVAEAQLAQFGLTGDEIRQLIPLIADYAAKTGKDLPAAALTISKALLGQGRALKDVGIDFVDAGSAAANFDQLITGLGEKVAGFGEKDVLTAAGGLAQLENMFGEIKETLGAAFMPLLRSLAPVFRDMFKALEPVIGALGAALAPVLAELAVILADAAPQLVTLVMSFGDLLLAVVPIIPPLLQLVLAFTPLIPLIVDSATFLVSTFVPAIVQATAVLTPLINLVSQLIGGLQTLSGLNTSLPSTIVGQVNALRPPTTTTPAPAPSSEPPVSTGTGTGVSTFARPININVDGKRIQTVLGRSRVLLEGV